MEMEMQEILEESNIGKNKEKLKQLFDKLEYNAIIENEDKKLKSVRSKSLKRKANIALRKLLSPLCAADPEIKKKYTVKKVIDYLPYVPINGSQISPINRRSKSTLKKKHSKKKRFATFATVEKLLRIHHDRKLGEQIEIPIDKNFQEDVNMKQEETMKESEKIPEYYYPLVNNKKHEECLDLNKDVNEYARNYENIRKIQENVKRLKSLHCNFIPSYAVPVNGKLYRTVAISPVNNVSPIISLSSIVNMTPNAGISNKITKLPGKNTGSSISAEKKQKEKTSRSIVSEDLKLPLLNISTAEGESSKNDKSYESRENPKKSQRKSGTYRLMNHRRISSLDSTSRKIKYPNIANQQFEEILKGLEKKIDQIGEESKQKKVVTFNLRPQENNY